MILPIAPDRRPAASPAMIADDTDPMYRAAAMLRDPAASALLQDVVARIQQTEAENATLRNRLAALERGQHYQGLATDCVLSRFEEAVGLLHPERDEEVV